MNFNHYFLIFSTLVLTGCGVKSDPVPPAGTTLPSIIEQFSDSSAKKVNEESEKEEKKKKQ